MRTNYIVTYDICEPKRLRKVFRACKDYGLHLQLSVFECDLTAAEKIDFESQLRGLIDSKEDQILFIALGPSESRGERVITSIGQNYIRVDLPCYVA
jgi:CRISPR-associated protein Cas2